MALRSLSDIVSHFFSSMYPRQMYFIFFSWFATSRGLSLFYRYERLLGELLGSFLEEFRLGCGAEVFSLEHLPNLNLGLFAGHRIRTALDPFNRVLQRGALP